MRKKHLLAAYAAIISSVSYASDFTLSGFGTLAANRLSTANAQYRTDSREPNGVDDSWNTITDSKIGLRGSYRFNDNFSTTLTTVAQHNNNNTFTPRIEWAYGDYRLMSGLNLRAGRLGLPAFMASDYLNVNYSMTAVRGPIEVYSQLPITHVDGLDMIWRTQAANINLTVQPIIGHANFSAAFSDADGTRADGKTDVYGVNVLGEMGDWTFRAGYLGANVTIKSAPTDMLIANLRAMGANDVANRLAYEDQNSSFSGVGVGYDNGTLIGQAEYTMRRAHGFLADTNAWYALGGYRVGKFTPYAVIARQRVVSETSWSDVPAPMSPYVNGLLASGNTSQRSVTLGVRWDFMTNFDAKLQVMKITPEHGSNAGLLMYDGSKGFLGSQNLLTLSIDAIF